MAKYFSKHNNLNANIFGRNLFTLSTSKLTYLGTFLACGPKNGTVLLTYPERQYHVINLKEIHTDILKRLFSFLLFITGNVNRGLSKNCSQWWC